MKDRVTYESQVLFVGPATTGQVGQEMISGLVPTQLQRIQEVSSEIETNDRYVYALGKIDSLGRGMPSPPTVTLDIQYVLGDAQNEKWLGLSLGDLTTPAVSGWLSGNRDDQNFYLTTVKRGDAISPRTNKEFLETPYLNVVSFGNCSMQGYTVAATVDSIPTATVSMSVSNTCVASGVSGIENPAVNAEGLRQTGYGDVTLPAPVPTDLSVDNLRPSKIFVDFGSTKLKEGGAVLPGTTEAAAKSACSVESFSIDFPINRHVQQRLGSAYPISKRIIGPNQVLFSCVAKTKDLVSGNLMDIICEDSRDITVTMNNPNLATQNMMYSIKGASLQTQATESLLILNEEVELTFAAPVGGANIGATGFYISGIADKLQPTTYGISEFQLLNNQLATR